MVAAFCVASALTAGGGGEERAGTEFFEARIRPLLAERCYRCHGAGAREPKGALRLDTRAGVRRGGSRGPVLVPGDPARSLLLRAVRYEDEKLRMPPSKRLSDAQIADLEAWVLMGAPDPRGGDPEPPAPASTEAARSHWAFQPLREPPLPEVKDRSWPLGEIDRFVLARLEERGLSPSPPADRRTLIRRMSYDLTGLPPTAEEVEEFERDARPEAHGVFPPRSPQGDGGVFRGRDVELVDRLLASPRHGERWGRHWLDVARYADTKGYAYDREERRFVHSHVYRDWVIRALNEDLPYDRFIELQLAADLLVEQGDRRGLAAMGYLTVGRRFVNNMHDIIDDRIDVVMRGLQGLTAGCARCHDHKFDPIPTRDYYSLYGVFAGSTERTVCLEERPASTPEDAAYRKGLAEREEKLQSTFRKKRDELAERLRARSGEYLAAVLEVEKLPTEEFYAILGTDDLNPVVARQWQAYLFARREGFHAVFGLWHELARLPARGFAEEAGRTLAALAEPGAAGKVNSLVREAFLRPPPASMKEAAERYGKVLTWVQGRWREEIENAKRAGRSPPDGLADPAEEELRAVLYGPDSPALVPAGVISEVEWFFDEGTRVELSRLQAEIDRWLITAPGAPPHAVALADRQAQRNPRVFLRGNPASRGEEVPRRFLELLAGPERKPFEVGSGRLELAQAISSRSNPLTARVMVNRVWLHHFGAGLVRTPSDFGTRSEPPSHPELLDWLALRFMEDGWSLKRLHRRILLSRTYRQSSAERPEGLRLDPENRLLWKMNRSRLEFEALRDGLLAATGELDLTMGGRPAVLTEPPFSLRRTVYGFVDRQFLPGVFRVFDFANPDLHSPQRFATTIPQQALFLLNSPFVAGRARAAAARPEVASASEPAERVRALYRSIHARLPSPGEIEEGLEFIRETQARRRPLPPLAPSPWRYGFGEYDEAAGKVRSFELLPHFTGAAWQGGPAWPDPRLGWVQLGAAGGHAGNDRAHAAVRRWVAPRASTVSISGKVSHAHAEGDGVRAWIASSRSGRLWGEVLHNRSAEAKVEEVRVEEGDTLDFVVDLRDGLNSDDFSWAPVVRERKAAAGAGASWDARRDFAGPAPEPLGPWDLYAQALLVSNEFVFVD